MVISITKEKGESHAEKAELLNAFFASVFRAKASPQESQALETREKDWRKTFPWLRKIV